MSSSVSLVSEEKLVIVSEDELQGLIFDCDGTLVDSMPGYWLSWKETCDHFSLNFTQKRFYELAGVPVEDIFSMLIDECSLDPKPSVEECCIHKKKVQMEIKKKVGTPGINVVIDIAKKYHGKKPLAVASSGWRDHVLNSLRENNIEHLFDAIVTAEDITNPKPAPDIFLEAAKRINCNPQYCRGYEDGEIGLQALRAANMEAIDVRNFEGYPKPDLD